MSLSFFVLSADREYILNERLCSAQLHSLLLAHHAIQDYEHIDQNPIPLYGISNIFTENKGLLDYQLLHQLDSNIKKGSHIEYQAKINEASFHLIFYKTIDDDSRNAMFVSMDRCRSQVNFFKSIKIKDNELMMGNMAYITDKNFWIGSFLSDTLEKFDHDLQLIERIKLPQDENPPLPRFAFAVTPDEKLICLLCSNNEQSNFLRIIKKQTMTVVVDAKLPLDICRDAVFMGNGRIWFRKILRRKYAYLDLSSFSAIDAPCDNQLHSTLSENILS